MIPRKAASALVQLAKQFPVVGIVGPRQSGKTTLAKVVFPNKQYVTFDDTGLRKIAQNSPQQFLAAFPEGCIIDEAQKVPDIFDAVKLYVDREETQSGKYILTGSSQFNLRANMADSLAGRAAYVKLLPFSMAELQSTGLLPDNFFELLLMGGYPPLYDVRRKFVPANWFDAYVDTYLDLDVKEQINVSNVAVYKKFIRLCALRSGQILSMNSMSRDLGVSVPTIKSWLSVLEDSFVVQILEPMGGNLGKSLTRAPKLYFTDTGLLCHLLKISSVQELLLSPLKGAVVETFAVAEMLKGRFNRAKGKDLGFYRDTTGLEVDVIADWDQQFAVEIKSSDIPDTKLVRNLLKYKKMNLSVNPVVFYTGPLSCVLDGVQYCSWKDWGRFCD